MSHVLLPGKRLSDARDAKGLSVTDVAQALHMSTAYVKALEADDYERLPEAAFVKGYLRNYARLVGLPGDDIANMFSQVMAEEVSANTPERTEQSSTQHVPQSWLLYAGISVVALIIVLWFAFSPEAVDVSAQDVGIHDEPVAAAVVEPTGDEAPLVDGAIEDVEQEFQLAEAEAEEEALTPLAEVVAVSADVLKVNFSDDCWVKVSDATGATVFTGQKSAANKLVVRGQSPFRVTLGNAAAVSSITVNDSSVSVPTAKPGRVLTLRAE
tara:strand:+ start:2162 stop:2968 length:807 start_codon:yes stop_codon:yes gene_type:complete